jgi:hypothetical protein
VLPDPFTVCQLDIHVPKLARAGHPSLVVTIDDHPQRRMTTLHSRVHTAAGAGCPEGRPEMSELDELVARPGVLMAGRFGPDGRAAEHKTSLRAGQP